MPTLRFCVLDVGQGTGTLVQSFDDSNPPKPTWSAVIDLGSEGWKHQAGEPSARFVAQQLQTRPVLDSVLLSHSDADHINLLPTLLGEFSKPRTQPIPGKPVLNVNQVWFGGDYAKYKKAGGPNLLDQLNEFSPTGANVVGNIANGESSWEHSSPKPLVASGTGIGVWLLIGNTIADQVSLYSESPTGRTPSSGYATNTKSLVLVVVLGSGAGARRIIATGDATGLTLAKCCEVIEKRGIPLAPCLSVTLPHHGSETTTYDLAGASSSQPAPTLAEQNVVNFVKHTQPTTISASAGERSTFRHPSIRVITDFGAFLASGDYVDPALTAAGEHFYTSFFPSRTLKYDAPPSTWPSTANWYSVRNNKDVFTTDYFLDRKEPVPSAFPPTASFRPETGAQFKPPPPRAIAWAFVVSADGSRWKVEPAFDRDRLSSQQVDWLERALGHPLPPERFFFVPSAGG
jgi:hypothetical protein